MKGKISSVNNFFFFENEKKIGNNKILIFILSHQSLYLFSSYTKYSKINSSETWAKYFRRVSLGLPYRRTLLFELVYELKLYLKNMKKISILRNDHLKIFNNIFPAVF